MELGDRGPTKPDLGLRRSGGVLARLSRFALAAVVELAGAEFDEPGMRAFPKALFRTAPGEPSVPDGRSLAYLEMAEAMRAAEFRTAPAVTAESGQLALSCLHQELIEAHVLERRLLAELEAST